MMLTAYVVDTPFDDPTADGSLSLREAVTAANTNLPFADAVGPSPTDTAGR